MKKMFYLCMGLAMTAAMTACDSNDEPEPVFPAPPVIEKSIEQGLNDASIRISNAAASVWNDNTDENNIISPLSMSMLLGMTANACTDDACSEIMELFGLHAADLPLLNRNMADILTTSHDMPESALLFSNSMWLSDKYKFSTNLNETVEKYYNATAQHADLNSQSGADIISEWVNQDIKNKMEYSYSVSPMQDVNFMELSMLYFKADWMEKFDKKNTTKKQFKNYDSSKSMVDMMESSQEVAYAETERGDRFAKLYYKNRNITMSVYLPADPADIDALSDFSAIYAYTFPELNGSYFQNIGKYFQTSGDISITMPLFELKRDINLKKVAEAVGINSIFETGESFAPGIIPNDSETPLAYLTDMDQVIDLTVNEDGAEIKVVSSGKDKGDMAPGPVAGPLVLDRPFQFMVSAYGTVIAVGRIMKL